MPDAENFNKMKNELSFKESRVKHSKSTLTKLEAELKQRREEVEKIDGLDKKIALELQSFRKKITEMKREAKTFKSTEQLNSEAKAAKLALQTQKVRVCVQVFGQRPLCGPACGTTRVGAPGVCVEGFPVTCACVCVRWRRPSGGKL